MTKSNWVNTLPNSGNGNGSIQVTAQANEGMLGKVLLLLQVEVYLKLLRLIKTQDYLL